MLMVRRWSIRHSRFLESLYDRFADAFRLLDIIFRRIGYKRVEPPLLLVERNVKGFLFDCQMCGTCILGDSGMSCPMNCPKTLRNGPCGGVRPDGCCEVKPEMRCVWVAAWEGSRQMRDNDRIQKVQPPVAHHQKDSSAWLRSIRGLADLAKNGTGT